MLTDIAHQDDVVVPTFLSTVSVVNPCMIAYRNRMSPSDTHLSYITLSLFLVCFLVRGAPGEGQGGPGDPGSQEEARLLPKPPKPVIGKLISLENL